MKALVCAVVLFSLGVIGANNISATAAAETTGTETTVAAVSPSAQTVKSAKLPVKVNNVKPAAAAQSTETKASSQPKTQNQTQAQPQTVANPWLPVRISIGGVLSTTVQSVGLTSDGAIAVPGATAGWWNGSARPGDAGVVFVDGHSTGVFRNLPSAGVGSGISLTLADGSTLDYRVVSVETFDYDYANSAAGANHNMMVAALSARGGAYGLNLMTCAGVPVGNTYSQRLVVFAQQIR